MIADKLKGLIVVGFTLSIVGIIFLIFSVNLGTSLATIWIFREGGADSSYFDNIVTKGYINGFLATGSIFLVVGLFTILTFYYKKVKIQN